LHRRAGLELDPTNAQLQQGLKDSQAAKAEAARGKGIFANPEVLARLATNPQVGVQHCLGVSYREMVCMGFMRFRLIGWHPAKDEPVLC
jgi:hypothetical protein